MGNQSQYATIDQFQNLSCTPASFRMIFDAVGFSGIVANLQFASSKADIYMSSQLILPLTSWDQNLSKCVSDIAAFELQAQIGYNAAASGDANLLRRYDQAMDFLHLVSRKELILEGNPNYVDSSGSNPNAGRFVISSPPLGFGMSCCSACGLISCSCGWL